MADGNGAGGNQVFQVLAGDNIVIDSFGSFGNGGAPLDPLELDTLRFSGSGLIATNLLLRQVGADVLVTFAGVANTSVTLTNITIEQLENIAAAGNFQFNGEPSVSDSVDVWSASQISGNVAAPDRTTFLNDLPNQISGLDASQDVINGQGGNDQLNGLGGDDTLRGGAGNDLLDGGTGNDRLEGGTGNDIYIVDSAGDQVVEAISNANDGGWSDEVRSSVSFSLASHANIERLTLTGGLAINGTGNSGHNILTGNEAANTLNGGGGNDTLAGAGGNDTLLGGAGNDALFGGTGEDVLDGGTGADRMEGGRDKDIYIVDSASDVVVENISNAQGGGWSDEVRASITFDLTTHLNIEGLRLTGTANINGIANSGNNFVFGNDGNNILRGRDGNDRLLGGAGNDTLDGGRGSDTLTGGTGNDTIDGGDGQDIAVFAGNFSDYTFSPAGPSFYVQDMNTANGNEGNDFVSNVEVLRFADRDVGVLRSLVDSNAGQNHVLEGSPNGTLVGVTAHASHSLGGAVVYTLTNNAGGRFAIDPATGVVSVANGVAIDYETAHQHTITVRATDPETGLYRDQSFAIAVDDVPDEDVSIIDLATLDSGLRVRILGAAEGHHVGYSLSSAGDLNGDGLDDIVVSTLEGKGGAYVVFGRADGGTIDLATITPAEGYHIAGIGVGDMTGRSVSNAGDINGDGFADIVVGAPGSDVPGYNAGQVHVIYGGATGDIDLANLAPARGFTLSGPSDYDFTGLWVSDAGDVNGDGLDDIVIGGVDGTRGQAFVVYGAEGGLGDINLADLTSAQGFRVTGTAEYTSSGFSVSSAGDVNGDGLDDIIIGGESARPDNRHYAGESYIIFGQHGGSGDIDIENLTPSQGIRIAGASEYDFSGYVVSGAGDVNGDGFSDVFIGAPGTDDGKRAYVIYGRGDIGNLDLGTITSSDGFSVFDSNGDFQARSISIAGDVNGDGIDDLIVDASGADPEGRFEAGASFVVYGTMDLPTEIDLATLTSAQGFKVIGAASWDHLGHAVSGAGDVNGDGFADLAISALYPDPEGRLDAGETYILYGGNFTNSVSYLGDDSDETIVSDNMNAVLIGGGGDDSITATGQSIIYGGSGDDRIVVDDFTGQQNRIDGGSGIDTLAADSFDYAMDLGGAWRGRISDIEIIDLTGVRSNVLSLDSTIIGGLSGDNGTAFGANTLLIRGDSADLINLTDQGWTEAGTINDPHGQSGEFVVWQNGAVTALIETGVSVSANNIELSRLHDGEGIVITGAAAHDSAGRGLAYIGDVNGDGIDDIAVGSPGADPSGRITAGTAYVIYGRDDGGLHDIDLADLTAADGFRVIGAAAGHSSSYAIGRAGDINGDGIDDLILGAPGADGTGSAFVVYGVAGGLGDIDLASLTAAQGFRVLGASAGDTAGVSVNSAGDINGDGFDDLVIGAPGVTANGYYGAGQAYLVYGGNDLANIDLATMTQDQGFRLTGTFYNDAIGRSVSSAGDINGDGIDDFAVAGVRGTHAKAFIVYGQEDNFDDINLVDFTPAQGFTILGTPDFDSGGFAVARAGDVNGDGFDDIILGDSSARQPGRHYSGESYVIYGNDTGHTDIDVANLLPSQGFRISGAFEYDFSGSSVSSAGDINGDGFDDILIGAPSANPSDRYDAGIAYVIFGGDAPTDIDLRHLTVEDGFKIAGDSAGFFAGARVSSAGDLNHDGYDDLMVSATGADIDGRTNAGQVFVIYGREFGTSTLQLADLLDDGPNTTHDPGPVATFYAGPPNAPLPEPDIAVT
jgi:Ca2+-binding RTX toxin-like protein